MRLKIEQPPTIFLWIGTNNSAMLITTDFPKKKNMYIHAMRQRGDATYQFAPEAILEI